MDTDFAFTVTTENLRNWQMRGTVVLSAPYHLHCCHLYTLNILLFFLPHSRYIEKRFYAIKESILHDDMGQCNFTIYKKI